MVFFSLRPGYENEHPQPGETVGVFVLGSSDGWLLMVVKTRKIRPPVPETKPGPKPDPEPQPGSDPDLVPPVNPGPEPDSNPDVARR